MTDIYHTLAQPSTGLFRDRGSKFLAFAYPINEEQEVHAHIETLKKLHPKARHYCYAYRIGLEGLRFRANDDGEPSGTAGRPILGQIDSFGLTNVAVIVVRYFGGTLLGASGLIQAYRAAAEDALQQAEIIEKQLEDRFRIEFTYLRMSDVMNALKKLHLPVYAQDFSDQGVVETGIPRSQVNATLLQLKVLISGLHLEEVQVMEEMEGFSIQKL